MLSLETQKKSTAVAKVLIALAVVMFSFFAFCACGEGDGKTIDKIVITQSKIQLVVGTSEQLTLTLTPSNATDVSLAFVSADTSVATVSREGIVQAIGVGSTTVSVTATKGGASAVVPVVVTNTPVELSKVSGVQFDGEKVVWDRVDNNYGYEVTLNDTVYDKTLVTEYFTDFEVGVENKISVRALGNSKAYLDSEPSDDFVFTQLSTPTISIEQGEIVIVPNSDATIFEILMNGQTHKNRFTSQRYIIESDLEAGFYAFKVRSLGNTSQNTYNSSFSNTITVTKLSAPTSAQVEDRVLTFESVVGAQSYDIKIVNNENNETSLQSIPAASSFVEYNLGEGYQAGAYDIFIMAKGDKHTTLDSAFSTQFAVDKLSKPANFKITNGLLTWDTVDNATGYALSVEHNGEVVLEEEIVDPQFEFAKKYIDAGKYKLTVTATGGNVGDVNRFVNSDASDELEVTKLPMPESFAIRGDDIVWGTVEQSTGYSILLDDSLPLPVQAHNYIDLFDTATQTFVAKKYSIRTKAMGNNKEIIDSEYSQTFECKKIGTVDPDQTMLSGGVVTWQGLADVLIYDVFINGAETPLRVSGNSIDFSNSIYASGNYSIKVQAISSDNLSVSGEQSSAITFTKLPSPSGFKVDGGVLYYEMPSGASYSGYNLLVGRTEYAAISDEYLDFDKYLSDDEQQNVCLQAIGDGQTTITSNYSDPISLHKVSSDIGLKVENGILSWNAQTGATGYEIEIAYTVGELTTVQTKAIDGANATMLNLQSDSMFESAGDYSVSIKAMGVTSLVSGSTTYTYDITSRSSAAVSVKKLAAITELKVVGGQITWEAVDGVTYYEVVVDGVSRGSECGAANFYFIAGSAGAHTVCVYARGDQANVLDAKIVDNTISVTKLSNVFNMSIVGAAVRWSSIVGANTYDVEVRNEQNEVVKSAQSIAATTYTFYGLEGGKSYYVRLRANGNNTNIVSGDFGAQAGTQTYQVKILEEPRNIRIEDNILYFGYVENAVKYQVVFSTPRSQDTIDVAPLEGQTQGTFDVSEYLSGKSAGSYSIFMRSIDDSTSQAFVNSSYTSSTSIEKLGVPVFSVVNGVLTYTQIYSAVEYELGIKSASAATPTMFTNDKDETTFLLDNRFTAGEYTAIITAKGNGSSTFSSETSTEFTLEKLRTPVASTSTTPDLEVKNGQLVWNAVDNASLYVISVYKYDPLDDEYKLSYDMQLQPKEQNTYLPSGDLGYYKIEISVKGDDTKYVDSDIYKYDKRLSKLNAPSGLNVKNGALAWTSNATALQGYELIINGAYVSVGSVNAYALAEGYSAITYTVMIRSVGDNTDTLTSDSSDPISAKKLEKIALQTKNGILTWTDTGARGYNIIVKNSEDVAVQNFETQETSYSLAGIDEGCYYVSITQLGTLVGDETAYYLNSDTSDEFSAYKLSKPNNLHINSDFTTTDAAQLARSGYLEWEAVENTTSYYVNYAYQTMLGEAVAVDKTYYKFDDDTLWVGEYQLSVYAGGDNVIVGTSEFKCINSDAAVIDAAKLAAPQGLSVSNGVFRWDDIETSADLDVNYMFCYYYAEDGQEFDMSQINIEFAGDINFHTLNKLGKYKLLVYAVGANCIQSDRSELDGEYLFNLFSAGSGSRSDPYIIKTFTVDEGSLTAKTYTAYEQLKYINYLYDKHFKLEESITIDSTYKPLGTYDELSFANLGDGFKFEGTIDGGNNTIYFDNAGGTAAFGNVGNFGLVSAISEKGIVRNLTLSNFIVSGSYNKIGIVTATNYGTIRNVKVSNTSGGITSNFTGRNEETYVGGIAGENYGTINGCASQILINATNNETYVYAGGIVGYNMGIVIDSQTLAMYDGVKPLDKQIRGAYVGGIAGYNSGNTAKIDGCKNAASLYATTNRGQYGQAVARAGGIVGVQKFEEVSDTGVVMPIVSNCYNVGLVNALASGSDSGEDGSKAGGILGLISGGTVHSCYNAGSVYTTNDRGENFDTTIGAIVGWNNNSEQSYVYNCYYVDYQGIPVNCTQSMKASEMTKVSEAQLKADGTQADDIINKLNEEYAKFEYREGGYPKLDWETA